MKTEITNQSASLDEMLYQQLKLVARKLMAKERKNHTLSATDLVHEAFMKLSSSELSFESQQHYYYTFARQMRRVLVNYAHQKNSKKNQADIQSFTESLGLCDEVFSDFSQINRAIEHLHSLDERSAQSIELVYFTNLNQSQAATIMDISLATLERDLKFGRVIIHEYLGG
ncbi:MAG: ECF-type sigma factor [bacterium]